MAFKIPSKPVDKNRVIIPEDPSLPKFCFSDAEKQEELGRGSFASTFKAKYGGNIVAIKQLHINKWDETGKKFMKEVKIMNSLKNDHIVRFKAVSYSPLAIMTEYALFDFRPFGGSTMQCNSLNSLMDFVRTFNMRTIESFNINME